MEVFVCKSYFVLIHCRSMHLKNVILNLVVFCQVLLFLHFSLLYRVDSNTCFIRDHSYYSNIMAFMTVRTDLVLFFSCSKQMKWKTRKGYHRRDNFAVCSVSNHTSLRSGESTNIEHEVLYDIPCDTQTESPFRQTQRVLRQESLREVPPALFSRGSDSYRSGSWRRITNGSQKEMNLKDLQINNPEIRCVYPNNSSERSFRDASYIIHKVQAQCHGMRGNEMGTEYYQPEQLANMERSTGYAENDDVQLAETYSLPGPSRKTSDNDSPVHLDTSDLYAYVEKAMTRLSEDRLDQISSE